MTQITIKRLADFADEQVRTGERGMKEFAVKLSKDAAYAFEWSNNAFKDAAKVHVGKTLQAWIEMKNGKTLEEYVEQEHADVIMEEVNRTVVRAARWPERSTSVQSNVMKQEIAAVWAELSAKQQGW